MDYVWVGALERTCEVCRWISATTRQQGGEQDGLEVGRGLVGVAIVVATEGLLASQRAMNGCLTVLASIQW